MPRRVYDYTTADLQVLEGILTDQEISKRNAIPIRYVAARRKEIGERVESRRAEVIAKSEVDADQKLKAEKVTAVYLDTLKRSEQSIAPIAQGLLSHIQRHADRDTLLSPGDINQLATAVKTLQGTFRNGLSEMQKSVMTLLDYEVMDLQQASAVFDALDTAESDFRDSTRRVLRNSGGQSDQSGQDERGEESNQIHNKKLNGHPVEGVVVDVTASEYSIEDEGLTMINDD